MHRRLWVLIVGMGMGLGWTTPVRAQEEIKPEQLKKMYEDAVANLKAAQDRKNQLAEENEKLKADALRLEAQAREAHSRIDALEGDAARFAARTYDMRLHLAAWDLFLRRHPGLRMKWELFLDSPIHGQQPPGTDLFAPPPATTPSPESQPATQPTTRP